MKDPTTRYSVSCPPLRPVRMFSLLALLGWLAFGPAVVPGSAQAEDRPNIVLITADDLGFDDLAGHGNPISRTPHLDRLGESSVQFSDFNVSPVCATTRAGLLTGRHWYRTGVSGVHGGRDFLRLEERLLSDVLSGHGYATGMWGKWHTGKTDGYLPWDRGFEEAYYAQLYVNRNSYGYTKDGLVTHERWVSEVITDYAIDFIGRNRARPFFAYLSFLAPHEPWEAPEEFVDKYRRQGEREAVANLYGMIEEMDFHIGRLLAYLDESGLADNTLILFMTDNGPWFSCSRFGSMLQEEWVTRNPSRLNGMKGRVWQNGIKSPLFVKYGNALTPRTVEAYVDVTDLFPFVLDFAGLELPDGGLPLDGESFLPLLHGQPHRRTDIGFYGSHDVFSDKENFNQWTPFDEQARGMIRFENQMLAVRDHRYKLILNPVEDEARYPDAIEGFALFDMREDAKETVNLYRELPEVAERLRRAMERRFADIVEAKGSFQPPVYLVRGDVSVVNAYGPSSTGGGVKSAPHLLTNFKEKGDRAEYHLRVAKAGRYQLVLDKKDHGGVGFEFRIRAGGESFEVQLGEFALQRLGEIDLPEGDVILGLELIDRHGVNPWDVLNTLHRIYVVSEDAEFSPADVAVPN